MGTWTNNGNRCRFRVRKTKHISYGEVIYTYAIVLADVHTGLIIAFTPFADYILYKVPRDVCVFRSGEKDIYAVCDFLNFLFIDERLVRNVSEITIRMAELYLEAVATALRSKDGDMPGNQTVRDHRRAISIFLETLACYGILKHIKFGSLIYQTECVVQGSDSKRVYTHYNLKVKLQKRDTGELKCLMRDMPLEIAQRFLDMALVHDPELVFPLVLMLYVGLRGGEVCNVFRGVKDGHTGVLVSTISYKGADGEEKQAPEAMQICLLREYSLRSDNVMQGRIKCERIQTVYSQFLETILHFYRYHLSLIEDKPCETIGGIRPMFLNLKAEKNGIYMAMTVSGLRDRINTLYKNHVLPSCENDPDPKLSLYYLQMRGHTWGKHAFRHYYTILLLYCGVDDPVFLKTLRGDRSIRSAETYIRNKGVLLELYKASLSRVGEMILPKGGMS